MCGFSQQSYDRIHKFEFDRITENIRTIASDLRSAGYKKRIQILFHIYRFNAEELRECQRFANDLGISLAFYDAYVNDWWQLEALVHNTLPDEKRRKMLDDLFISETQWSNAPNGWPCPQWDLMVIDERGNVPVCCNLPNNHPSYSLGALDNGIAKRLQNRPNLPICKTCMESGMSYYTHHIRFRGDPSMLRLARRQIASRMRKDPRALFGLPQVIDLLRQGTEWMYLDLLRQGTEWMYLVRKR
jgi:MoaA/NifB/PqqE/SkfB family radical SAM enzyme